MKVIVVGLGVQGHKRRDCAKGDFVASVDPVQPEAQYRSIADVPLQDYDAALVCTPDGAKPEILRYLIEHGKHCLAEKPLWFAGEEEFDDLQGLARRNGAVCYTAYNHRFEPHFIRMRDLIASGRLGEIYRCRMFYGNGTARLVRDSEWRDAGAGVLPDLGSHLLDTIDFWFGPATPPFEIVSASRHENMAPDHVVIAAEKARPKIELEMTLLMWRNHFTCDILAEKGTAHIESLCKWGPSKFIERTRILPAGRPPEETVTLVQDDPTWSLEYEHFKSLCRERTAADLTKDRWLHRELSRLGASAIASASQ